MSYLGTGDIWQTFANAAGGTSKGTVGQDVIQIWSEMKRILVEKLGPYKLADGQIAIIDGKKFPQMTMSQAQALRQAWFKFGDAMLQEVIKAERPTSGVTQAQMRFNNALATWALDVSTVYGGQLFLGKYLFAPAVRDLFNVIDRFAIDLSSQAWASVNIETPLERMYEALDETTGGSLLKVPLLAAEAVSKGIPAVGNMLNKLDDVAEIVKWTAIGGGLFMLYWYVLRD